MSHRDTRVAMPVIAVTALCRRAFTLLELVVVLAIIGLGIAVVAPSLVLRPPSSEESMKRVVASARRVAMRRAQTVTLDVDDNGVWRVAGAGRDTPEVLLRGELDERPLREVHLRITPLGLCLSEARGAGSGQQAAGSGQREAGTGNGYPAAVSGSVSFDPLTCALREKKGEQQ